MCSEGKGKGQQTRTGHVAGIGLLFFLHLELVFFLGVFHAGCA